MDENQKATTVGALMLMAGGLIGAGMGMLFAPQSGRKTRKQIGRYAKKVRNETEAMIRDSADAVSEAVEDLGEKTSDMLERGGDVAEEWRKHLLDTLDQGQKNLDRQRKKLADLWKS